MRGWPIKPHTSAQRALPLPCARHTLWLLFNAVDVPLHDGCRLRDLLALLELPALLPDLLIEPYVVYRYIFHKKTVVYYRKYFFFLLSLMVMFPFLELGSRLEVLSFGGLLLKGLVFAGVSVVYVLLIGWIACRKELAFFGRLAKGVVTWRIKRD